MAKTQTRAARLWPVEKLIPYANNPRTHSGAQNAQIADSIEEFGFTNPILVDTTAGILAGHGRLRAAQKLGPGKVPMLLKPFDDRQFIQLHVQPAPKSNIAFPVSTPTMESFLREVLRCFPASWIPAG